MLYMCPVCKTKASCGRCCTDEPIPCDAEAIRIELIKLKRKRIEFEAMYSELLERIIKGSFVDKELREGKGEHR